MNKSPSRNLHGLPAEILFTISLAFVGTCLAPDAAAAQTASTPIPSIEDRRQQERERSLRKQQERGFDVRLPSARGSGMVRLPRDEVPCFVVSRLELQGDLAARFGWSLDGAAGDGGDDPPTGRCLGAAGIDLVVARVQRSIVERGHITTRVLVGPQDLSTGTLTLTVVPGRISAIRAGEAGGQATPGIRNAIPSKRSDLLELRDIEQLP